MKTIKSYNVCFLGRTGNGKSSLINAMFGTDFSTNPLVSCTKEMYSVTLMDGVAGKEAITVYDTPGIGEFSNNERYYRFYEHSVSISDCVVIVMTMDRTYGPLQRLLISLEEILGSADRRYVVAINHIDSNTVGAKNIPLWDEMNNCPTQICLDNIAIKISDIKKYLTDYIPSKFEIIPVCAKRKYNLDKLYNAIINNLA